MLHPATVHFAVVLPLIALIIGLVYLLKPSDSIQKISTGFVLFGAIFVGIAFLTGKEDAGAVFEFLSSDGKSALKEHAKLGQYLAIATGLVAALNLFGYFKKLYKVELLSIVLVAAISAGVLYQGKMGGEITYKYGAHVEGYSDGKACIEEKALFEDD
ncbi:DUF2231 domain-containing protein [Sulfurimonas sp.]|uniref:DUF2231 domain-containing protein n=1 Tax=Sulfurimonas sp. TaxID=2022749 RepID=UPI0025DAD758|nr:DUF2231 domain-containing protein [Sulfurimonas sp.]MBW6487881.1 hypothetical protein [Sulfurimonas sp.]